MAAVLERDQQFFGRSRARGGVHGQHTAHQRDHPGKHFPRGQLRNGQDHAGRVVAHFLQRHPDEGSISGQRVSQGRAQRINVRTRIRRIAHKLLRAGKSGRAKETTLGQAGLVLHADDHLVITPAVSISATAPRAVRSPKQTGDFVLEMSAAESDITVSYKISGTAVAGVDYKALTGTATFPAGSTKAKIKVKPFPATDDSDSMKVKVKLLSGNGYTLGSPGNATVKIVGD